MKFVDRTDEAARLKDALSREKSSLVVVYGRRRLGKSTLIKRVLSDSDVYFLADRFFLPTVQKRGTRGLCLLKSLHKYFRILIN